MPKEPHREDGVGRMQFLLDLRRRGINDVAVLRALDEVARERFVDDRFADDAYADRALPIACGQTISQPFVVAYMTGQLGVRPEHRVLEVGTGSGYQAAVLSRLAREVVTVERYRTLAETARARLVALGYENVDVIVGDGVVCKKEHDDVRYVAWEANGKTCLRVSWVMDSPACPSARRSTGSS